MVCEDFDAGNPPPWVHWVIYKIPATAKGLPEGLPIDPEVPMPADIKGAVQGLNGWKRAIYRGPAPPAGKPHGYHFVVYALDTAIGHKGNDPYRSDGGDEGSHHRPGRNRSGLRRKAPPSPAP